MPRQPRLQYAGAWHHVMNRGASHQATFRDPDDRRLFLEYLADSVARFEIEVHGYCLMTNHYHLLVRTPEPCLNRAMQHLGSRYTAAFNRRHGNDGALFRGRYKSLLIESERYALAVSRYIHRNPISLGVAHLADHPWSSYPAYLGDRPPPGFLETATLLELVGGVARYEALVELPIDTYVDVTYEQGTVSASIGEEAHTLAA